MMRAALCVLALAVTAHAGPVPDPHPFPWITGEALLQKLERPRKPSDPTEAAAYMMGIEDATADRDWCYSKTKPGTSQIQPALLDLIRSLPPAEAKRNAALLAVRAWKKAWPCTPYEAWSKIRPRRGIVSFFHLHGGDWDPQGHIDLVEPASMNDLQCLGACYWSSTEAWFWSLR